MAKRKGGGKSRGGKRKSRTSQNRNQIKQQRKLAVRLLKAGDRVGAKKVAAQKVIHLGGGLSSNLRGLV